MKAVQEITIGEDEGDIRLDRWFRRHFPNLAHGRLQKLLRTGQVRVDGKRVEANLRLATGQIVRVPPLGAMGDAPPPRQEPVVSDRDAEDLLRRVLYRDEHVLVLNKPYGLAVQGGSKTPHHLDAMLDALRLDGTERPRLVHRLDRDTTGALVLARTSKAARALTEAFRGREVRKLYLAVTEGVPKPQDGTIDLPLIKRVGRPGQGEERMAVDHKEGQMARTRFRVIDQAGDRFALVALEPLTGRTHQLRVHCASIDTPIVGDGKYGSGEMADLGEAGSKLHLHAYMVQFPGFKGGPVRVIAPLPEHLAQTLKFLGLEADRRPDFLPI
jgi:23S rRNA pseudouridine955/2504/2580 synthase